MLLAVSFWLFASFNRNERAQIANGQKQIAKIINFAPLKS